MSKPEAGDGIADFWADVILGIRRPLVVLLTSSIALPSGDEPSVVILICALKSVSRKQNNKITGKKYKVLITVYDLKT